MKESRKMSNTLSVPNNYSVRKPPGRRKARGSLEFNSPTGRICFVLGYCDNCHHKVTASKEEMDSLKLSLAREKQKLGYRLLSYMLSRYEQN